MGPSVAHFTLTLDLFDPVKYQDHWWCALGGCCRLLLTRPEVTPKGKFSNVGVVVATPAVPVPGVGVGEWICDAVVPAVKPLNVTSTNNVFAMSSVVTLRGKSSAN
jgi:hypothetical protein